MITVAFSIASFSMLSIATDATAVAAESMFSVELVMSSKPFMISAELLS